jgi:hypothetical protein
MSAYEYSAGATDSVAVPYPLLEEMPSHLSDYLPETPIIDSPKTDGAFLPQIDLSYPIELPKNPAPDQKRMDKLNHRASLLKLTSKLMLLGFISEAMYAINDPNVHGTYNKLLKLDVMGGLILGTFPISLNIFANYTHEKAKKIEDELYGVEVTDLR